MKSDRSFRCERCGYSLDGLAREGDCPECGKSVLSSLPENRTGSAWQRNPGWRGVQATVRGVWRPKRYFAKATMRRNAEWGRVAQSAAAASLLAGLAPVLAVVGALFAMGAEAVDGLLSTAIISMGLCCVFLIGLVAFAALLALTVEWMGFLFGLRCPREVTATAIGHTSALWIFGAIVLDVSALAFGVVYSVFMMGDAPLIFVLGMVAFMAMVVASALITWRACALWRFANVEPAAASAGEGGTPAESSPSPDAGA